MSRHGLALLVVEVTGTWMSRITVTRAVDGRGVWPAGISAEVSVTWRVSDDRTALSTAPVLTPHIEMVY